ncbi:MAG: hypothetical protein ABW203_01740 [Novosphingobium sp.]
MVARLARLFVIRTRLEALLVTYGLALGAAQRGTAYLETYPGVGGWLLFGACMAAVMMAGAKMLDAVRHERERRDPPPACGRG